jgi:hypothetical protein
MTQTMSLWHHHSTQNSSSSIVSGGQTYIFMSSDLVSKVHKDDISREQLKELLYEEIKSFQPAPIT